ncbi:MAG: M50 family metallopeptidase [Oscillospiraceae bacterium]|nr:M50 family metallopeptidase [Oscillospiraceae bacterium]
MLNQGQRKRKRMLGRLAGIAVGLAAGVCLGLLVSAMDLHFPFVQYSLPGFLASVIGTMLVGCVLVTNIHELGHLTAGLLQGYRLLSYRMGPVCWEYENGKMVIRFRLNKGYSGLCAMLPPKRRSGRLAHLYYYAGGILFNLLTAGLLMLWLRLGAGTLWLRDALTLIAFFSLAIGLVNLIPYFSQGNPTDGKMIWTLLAGKEEAKAYLALTQVSAQLASGVRPGRLKLPKSLDCLPQGKLFEYYFLLDRGELDQAWAALGELERTIDRFPSVGVTALYYELCFSACLREDIPKAKEWHERVQLTLDQDKDANGLRVRAYYAWYAEGDWAGARTLAQEGQAVLSVYPVQGQAEMEGELLRKLLDLLDQG